MKQVDIVARTQDIEFVARRVVQKAERFLDTATAWDGGPLSDGLRRRILHDRKMLQDSIDLAREVMYGTEEEVE